MQGAKWSYLHCSESTMWWLQMSRSHCLDLYDHISSWYWPQLSLINIFCLLVAMSTTGDIILDRALSKVKSLFTVSYVLCAAQSLKRFKCDLESSPSRFYSVVICAVWKNKEPAVLDNKYCFYLKNVSFRLVRRVYSPKSWRTPWRGMSKCETDCRLLCTVSGFSWMFDLRFFIGIKEE